MVSIWYLVASSFIGSALVIYLFFRGQNIWAYAAGKQPFWIVQYSSGNVWGGDYEVIPIVIPIMSSVCPDDTYVKNHCSQFSEQWDGEYFEVSGPFYMGASLSEAGRTVV